MKHLKNGRVTAFGTHAEKFWPLGVVYYALVLGKEHQGYAILLTILSSLTQRFSDVGYKPPCPLFGFCEISFSLGTDVCD